MRSIFFARLVAPAFACLLAAGAGAADLQFNVATGDWQTAGNWSPATVPGSPDSAAINQGRVATINGATGTVGSSADPLNNLHIGGNQNGSLAGNGTLNQSGGTVFTDWVRVGRGNGRTGTYNLSGGTLNAGLNPGAGGLFVGGENDNATGSLNMTGGQLNIANRFRVGHVGSINPGGDSHGTFNLSAGTVNSSAGLIVGHQEGNTNGRFVNGTLLISGGAMTVPTLNVGENARASGTLLMTGGAGTVTGNGFRVGRSGGTAVISLTGGTLTQNTGDAVFGEGAGGNATVTHGGTHTLSTPGFWVGYNGSRGTYTLDNATLNVTGGNLRVGNTGGGTGVMTLNSGLINANTANFYVGSEGGATGVFTMNGGVINNGYNTGSGTFRVGQGSGTGTFNLNGGQLNVRQVTMGNNANDRGWFNQTGGTVRVGGSSTWLSIASSNAGQATWTATGGSLTYSGAIELGFRTGNTGVLTVAGSANYVTGGLNMSGGNPGAATLSRFNLEGGTYRADTMTIAHTATEFNWGSGVLALNTTSGTQGTVDASLGTSNSPFVSHGRQLVFQQGGYGGTGVNETIATGSGINASGLHAVGGNSVLNLGGLYLSAGTRFNQAQFNDGMSLDASAPGDTLMMDTLGASDTIYLLRPFGFFTEDYGSLPLIQFAGGGSLVGTFDTFIGLVDDGRGFAMSTFAVTSATANTLALNTWYLEQTGSGVYFHYKVAGTVPEPDTFALLALSALGLRTARVLRDRRSQIRVGQG
jgi:hypothetical protein